jgi:hypothetical protein
MQAVENRVFGNQIQARCTQEVSILTWSPFTPMTGLESMSAQQGDTGASSVSKGLVVFSIVRDSECSECGEEVGKGSFLILPAAK